MPPPRRSAVIIGLFCPLLRYWRRTTPRLRPKAHHATGGQKVKACGDFRRFVPSDWGAVRFLPADLIEGLPLCDPVGADAWPERFHLIAQVVQFAFQDLGALVELKLRKAFGEDRLDLIERMGLQEIQDHRIADDELAVDRFRMAGEPFGQHVQIDVGRRGDDGEAHEIFSAASRAPGDLLHLADRQVREVA